MELPIIVLAYAASATVAVLTTAVFSRPIDRVLFKLISDEMASAWSLFIKFALFCATFTSGMPPSDQAKFVGFNTPIVVPPIPGDGTMFVMRSVGGALMGASWFLLVFFGVTLTAYAGGRFYSAVREKKEREAKAAAEAAAKHEVDERARRDEAKKTEQKEAAEADARREQGIPAARQQDPVKRASPDERRPVTREKEEPQRTSTPPAPKG